MLQHDTQINLKTSASMQRDSESMKTIAAVTMVFLPGTFVATFFSMGFFHFGSGDDLYLTVAPQWWLYVAVTLPLTIAVLTFWRFRGLLETAVARIKKNIRDHRMIMDQTQIFEEAKDKYDLSAAALAKPLSVLRASHSPDEALPKS